MVTKEESERNIQELFKRSRESARRRMAETPEEKKARWKKERDESLERRKERVRGRNLVAEVLSHPNPSKMTDIWDIRNVLFNRSICRDLEEETIRRITNGAYCPVLHGQLVPAAALPDGIMKVPPIVDAWKYVYCDLCYLDEGANLHEIYEAQLQEEELQTPKARAKELIRTDTERAARRNAMWVVPALEKLSPQEISHMENKKEGSAFLSVWKQVSPPPPAWVQHIVDSRQPWGFVFYKAAPVQVKYGHRWKRTWETIREGTYHIFMERNRDSTNADIRSIHCRGNLSTLNQLWTEDWATVPDLSILSNDAALRRHFREYREALSSPGILRNIFLVVDPEPITTHLLEDPRATYDRFWLWAYDAGWEPSEDDIMPNGDVYRGRMKVLISCLDAWFYAACWEGVSLRDMWLKSRECPQDVWICFTDPKEAWKHEAYTK